VSGDVNLPCYVVWRERARLGFVFSCSATEKPSQITFCRSHLGRLRTDVHVQEQTSSTLSCEVSSVIRKSFLKIDVPVLHIPGSIQICLQRGQALTNPSLCRAIRHVELRGYLTMSATSDIS
jgi:hypothetical protein